MLKALGWDGDLSADERAAIEKVAGDATNWKTDLSGGIQRVAIKHGCAPYGNAKARCVVWTFPDPVPIHREPLYTPRRDLVKDYPTYEDRRRSTACRCSTQSIQVKDFSQDFPIILTSGRLVEYEGGGDETRSNPWLAELQQDMFVEINPYERQLRSASRTARWSGCKVPRAARSRSWPWSPSGSARGVAFMPFHFGGHFEGKDLRAKYPEGRRPLRARRGDATRRRPTATTR